MPSRQEPWPDLVEKALFEKDPNLRPQRLKDARKAIQDRLLELDVERKMLREVSEKLDHRRRLKGAKKAKQDRLQELDVEREMLLEASKKLDAG